MTAPDLYGTLRAVDGVREVRLRLSDGTWHLCVSVYLTGETLMRANSFKTVEAALAVYEAWARQQGEKGDGTVRK